MTPRSRHASCLSRIGLIVAAALFAANATADCLKDLRGEVFCGAGSCRIDKDGIIWCSRHYKGDAEKTLEGEVLCGIGKCARGIDGRFFCSSEIGGAVLVDSRGRVRCYGRCEPATKDHCESKRADAAEGDSD